ncbi:hypothetical protein MNQ98_27940 [Paenibacillus sp. N3/727]|uniref:hypothetical protein n=1 Tax=Paenibacillus sp. N3/727 TaxID=2925845 RepID=UPI001F533378|nr:hypothetical protein [Paenibacillus sp. N3/727]UNK18197.1 hypothetical protein MNQ98_27940 [Paenibacillus sp. N3/727]
MSVLASFTPISGEDKSKSAVPSQELALAKSNRVAPAPIPTGPVPERILSAAPRQMYLISTRLTEFSLQTAHIFLILKHMLLEPLKFRSNYVDGNAYLHLAL